MGKGLRTASRPWLRERGARAAGVGGIAPTGAYRAEVPCPHPAGPVLGDIVTESISGQTVIVIRAPW